MNPHDVHSGKSSDHSARIALVTRRFWPITGTTETAVSEIACAIKRAGHEVDIFTIRWEKGWPLFFKYQGIGIHRMVRPLNGPWGGFRYLRGLTHQLRELSPDGIIVFGLGNEAWTIAKAFGHKIPFMIRIDAHTVGFNSGATSLSARQLNALDTAQKLIFDSPSTAEQILEQHPHLREKAVIAPDPVFSESIQDQPPIKKNTARVAISDAHPVLMIEPDQPLVVTGAAMDGDEGILDLVEAWSRVLQRFPKARLWILGEGKKTRQVWELILKKQMVNSVIMPGSFDELRDVFRAADVYVHPLRSNQNCSNLKLAMAMGTCCISTISETSASIIETDENGILINPHASNEMAEAIVHTLSDESVRQRLGLKAAKSFSPEQDTETFGYFLTPFMKPTPSAVGSQSQESPSD